jgi:glycosyltransferase involved in cell wall biosynthesis
MQITFILPPPNYTGGVRVTRIYAEQLQRLGHAVRLVSPPPPTIPLVRKLKWWLKGGGWADDRQRPGSHLDGANLDHRSLDRYRPVTDDDVPDGDIVIATWWETAEWVAALGARKGVKVYFIQHHEIHEYLPIARSKVTYRLPFHKIVVARWLQQVMCEQYGDNAVDVVPNSVDRTQFFAPVRGKQTVPTVGFLYTPGHFKGVDTTLAALKIVRKQWPDLRLISFGLYKPTSSLPLPKNTHYSYMPPQENLRNLYAQCDAWVTASRSEGFNLPALEAMACRTPVVSTRTGWPEEAIKSTWNGVLVDVDDVVGLSRAVEWVLSQSEEEWRRLSTNAYATAATGSWEESAKMFEAALEHACGRAARGEIEGTCTLSAKAAKTR